ncbi:radical SAM protein [Nocardia salmonicida]|uniref:radical SAM protein n=1 Tax=Nocardia salmonicida TaxID=53431 RepID=UPI003624F606
MRLSTYTRIIDLRNGSSLLLNLPRRVADIIPTEHVSSLNDPGGVTPADPALTEYALSVGYLTEQSASEELDWFVHYVNSSVPTTQAANIAVVTTNACNLACSYCFQADTGMRSIPQRYLSMPEAIRVIEGVKKIWADRGVHHVELFGGEPLLPRTSEVVHYLVRSAAEVGLSTRATTNGVFLHEFTDILGPGMLDDLQISLDGPPEFHDRRRIPLAGQPTFEAILTNVVTAVAAGVHVLVRVNLDRRNIDGVPALLDILRERNLLSEDNLELQFINVQPDPLAPDRGFGEYYLSLAEMNDGLRAMQVPVPNHLDPIGSGTPLGEYLGQLMTQPLFDACGAPNRNIYFSPEGLVYNCHELVGRPDRAVGRFSSGTIVELPIWDKWRERRVDRLENCRECSVALAHGGGCGARLDSDELGRFGVCNGFPDEFDARLVALANGGQ